MIEPDHEKLSIRRQCELLKLHRSNLYYEPVEVSEETLQIMNHIDEVWTEIPFYGSRKIMEALRRKGWDIGIEKVRSLMRKMGIKAIYPRAKSLSKRHPNHKIYPYLLNHMDITHPNQVWSADITYIRLRQGFLYLVAIIDWFSRYVLSVASKQLSGDLLLHRGIRRSIRKRKSGHIQHRSRITVYQ